MLLYDVSVISKYGKQKLDEMIEHLNYNYHDVVALITISKEPGINQNTMARLLQTDKANISKILNSLQKRNLIKREEDRYDKRNRKCYLTDFGKKELHMLNHIVDKWEKFCLSDLTDQEKEIYFVINEKIKNNIFRTGTER